MSDILLIGSCEPFSGKSAMVLGIAKKLLQNKNLSRSKYQLALTELIVKLKILMNGSMKRGKKDFTDELDKKIVHFESLLDNE